MQPCTQFSWGQDGHCKRSSSWESKNPSLNTWEWPCIHQLVPTAGCHTSGGEENGGAELAVRFSCASTLNLMHAYFQSQLPRMHFFYPLDPKHSETLRVAAMNIVALKLMRSEPPLWQEVVRFMLVTEAERWSMRRSKANYYRIMVYMPIYNLLQFESSLFRLSCPWQPCQIFIRSISLLYGSYGLILSKNFHHPLIALLICISFTHELPLWTPVKAYGAGFWFIWS